MRELYICLVGILQVLEEIDNIPDTWYYYNKIEDVLLNVEHGLEINLQEVVELLNSTQQMVFRCKGNHKKVKELCEDLFKNCVEDI